jgi:hypothetical protein
MPLLTVEETHLKLKCAVCQKPLGKLPISTLKKMFDDFPKDLAKEWKLGKGLAITSLNHPKICQNKRRILSALPNCFNKSFYPLLILQ